MKQHNSPVTRDTPRVLRLSKGAKYLNPKSRLWILDRDFQIH